MKQKCQTFCYVLPRQASLGVKKPSRALLYVVMTLAGPYFKKDSNGVSLWADPKYIRAWRGGTGDCKMGGWVDAYSVKVSHLTHPYPETHAAHVWGVACSFDTSTSLCCGCVGGCCVILQELRMYSVCPVRSGGLWVSAGAVAVWRGPPDHRGRNHEHLPALDQWEWGLESLSLSLFLTADHSRSCCAEEKKDTVAETSFSFVMCFQYKYKSDPYWKRSATTNKSTCGIFFCLFISFFFRWGTFNSPPGRHHPARCNPTEHPGTYQGMGEEDTAMTGQHARMFGITFPLLLSWCVPRESWRCPSAIWPWASCALLWSSSGSKRCSAAALPAWSAPSQTLFTRER